MKETTIREFNEMLKVESENIGIDTKLIKRSVNEGFSGGEKKRNEMLQMALLKPELSVLDETDSGLDIDALKTVGQSVNKLSTEENATLIVTHYQRLLNYITPTKVHVLIDGKISKSGDAQLAKDLELRGYDWIKSLT